MVTVPAQSLLAPVLAWVMAAARVMPAVCGVFKSSVLLGTTWTPCSRQSLPACCVIVSLLSWLCSAHQKSHHGVNGTALSNFSGKNRGIQARRVFLPIDALIRSEQDTKHFGEAMSQRLIPESLNFTRLFP